MAEIRDLTEEEMNSISGGMIVNALGHEGNPNLPWEVVANHNCMFLGAFSTQKEAEEYAKKFGNDSYNTQVVDWGTVVRLRTNPNTN
ncbi:MAG: SPOR domain-containing protein [Lachnospiraceae bacterium]|nr:SPOR domain-containing protein [Lachnospiraceae bacterium]